MRNAIAALVCVLFAGTASAQGFIRYIYPPNVVSMIETDSAIQVTKPFQGLSISGKTNQLQLAKAAGGAKPTCDAAARGSIWYEPGGAGVLDTLEICRKDAANNYAWVSLF